MSLQVLKLSLADAELSCCPFLLLTVFLIAFEAANEL